jgi:hypothetical protein
MRVSTLPLLLAGLLGGAALAPAAVQAYPYSYSSPYSPHPYTVQRHTVETFIPQPRPRYVTVRVRPYGYGYSSDDRPMAVAPVAPVRERRCNPGTLLTGAVIGGGLGAVLADGSRNRRWALPMGAAMGGLLGGVASGC